MVEITPLKDGVALGVKVVPGASATTLAGEWNGRLRIRIAAPPEGGRANEALRKFMATTLRVRVSAVHITAGQTTAQKTVRIDGVSEATCHAALKLGQS